MKAVASKLTIATLVICLTGSLAFAQGTKAALTGFVKDAFGSGIPAATVTVKNVDTLIVGHSPLRTVPELREYERFMTDFVNAVKTAQKAGKSVDDAAASINLSGYQGYTHERYKPAVQAIYDELK